MDSHSSSYNALAGFGVEERRGSSSSQDERQRRRDQIVLWVILGQACIRGYLVRMRFRGMTREHKARLVVRNKMIRALIDTEQKYVHSLGLIEKCYMGPLVRGGCLSATEADNLFGTILANNADHSKGLEELIPAWNTQFPLITAGPAIDRLIKNSVRSYLNHADRAEQVLSALQQYRTERVGFADAILRGDSQLGEQGMDLEGMMRLPFQHLSQLGVVIENIIDYTPATHEDVRSLKSCAMSAKRTSAKGQSTVEEAHCRASLARIAPSIAGFDLFTTPEGGKKVRQYIREGPVAVNGIQKTYIFLFNDVLLVTIPQKQRSKSKSGPSRVSKAASPDVPRLVRQPAYKVTTEIPLKGARVQTVTGANAAGDRKPVPKLGKSSRGVSPYATELNSFLLEIITPSGEYSLKFLSTDEKHIWAKELKDLTHRLTFRGAFGMALEELLNAEKERHLGVPYVVFSIVNYLYTYAISHEDLFTKPGSSAEVEELRHMFDTLDKGLILCFCYFSSLCCCSQWNARPNRGKSSQRVRRVENVLARTT
eukprot:TRINITY_DN7813_c0_g1_i1.p1 TRINITY_DN7813_c0_g1~~TRINITY_DN7813_c0_g1_i1.p1  ORF type:complete len:540 (+),score=26.75 TRINITY_DN7813_c0_g1_i1:1-1620(+)